MIMSYLKFGVSALPVQMKIPLVHVASEIPHLHENLLTTAPQGVDVKFFNISDVKFQLGKEQLKVETARFLKESQIILCDPGLLNDIYDKLTNVKWVQSTWAGVESFIAAISEKKVTPRFCLTRHGGSAFSTVMAEYVLCQIMNKEKHIRFFHECQKAKMWPSEQKLKALECRNLNELVICLLGTGNMGLGIAKLLKVVGCKVTGFSRTSRNSDAEEYQYFSRISTCLDDLLPHCDYLCNTLPSTPKTHGLLNGDVLSLCKKAPIFINVGRGDIISEDSVLQALKKKWISGAVLDVVEKEPLPPFSALWESHEVTITPHIAAVSKASHVAEEFWKNYVKFTEEKKLNHLVDWSAGY